MKKLLIEFRYGDPMDFLESIQLLIAKISGLSVTILDDAKCAQNFEREYCFLPTHQRCYTADGLLELLEQKEKNRIYHLTDVLDTHAFLFNFDDRPILLGPYVTISWREIAAKELLTECGLGADMLMPYKVYRCRLPVVRQNERKWQWKGHR